VEVVSTGGTDNRVLISGAEQDVYGSAVGVTVFAGSQVVESGGTVNGIVVSSGGIVVVQSGGVASGATVSVGSVDVVFGTASGTTVWYGLEVVSSGGTVIGTTINGGLGEEIVFSRGTASGTTITAAS
jgi:autotransporter passenger strand-loop-strand repeat protein